MFAGLGLNISAPQLKPEEEDILDNFFAYLSIPPSEFRALPTEEREPIAALMRTWHLNKLTLTRTAIKK